MHKKRAPGKCVCGDAGKEGNQDGNGLGIDILIPLGSGLPSGGINQYRYQATSSGIIFTKEYSDHPQLGINPIRIGMDVNKKLHLILNNAGEIWTLNKMGRTPRLLFTPDSDICEHIAAAIASSPPNDLSKIVNIFRYSYWGFTFAEFSNAPISVPKFATYEENGNVRHSIPEGGSDGVRALFNPAVSDGGSIYYLEHNSAFSPGQIDYEIRINGQFYCDAPNDDIAFNAQIWEYGAAFHYGGDLYWFMCQLPPSFGSRSNSGFYRLRNGVGPAKIRNATDFGASNNTSTPFTGLVLLDKQHNYLDLGGSRINLIPNASVPSPDLSSLRNLYLGSSNSRNTALSTFKPKP